MNTKLTSMKILTMKFKLFVLLFVVIYLTEYSNAVVPQPYYRMEGIQVNALSQDLDFIHEYNKCNILKQAIKNIQKYLFNSFYKSYEGKIKGVIKSVNIIIKNGCEDTKTSKLWPSENMDEKYQISVNKDIEILSNEIWGVLRAFVTLFQLAYRNDEGTLLINDSIIYDLPRFNFRGILIDTSRHFLPVSLILENIEIMYLNKMNVLHWHIVDDESFPYQSYTFPNMSNFGAYHKNTYIYTQSDIRRIINYARYRGIRVMPEFDSPGHSLSWGKSITNLLTPCYSGSKPNGQYGPINPSLQTVFNFLKVFFTEIDSVFPDNYLHLGGDEVDFSCWKSNPDVVNFTKKMGFPNNFSKLQGYYMVKLVNTIKNLTKKSNNLKLVVWQDIFDNNNTVSTDSTIIHVWRGGWETEIAKVTEKYTAILSSCWYLDIIKYGMDWHEYYKCEPQNFKGGNPDRVIGGEACLWGEYIDETNFISRTWPRSSAIAERLWSRKNVTDINDMNIRLNEFRCRLLTNKFQVETSAGKGTYCNRPGFKYPIM